MQAAGDAVSSRSGRRRCLTRDTERRAAPSVFAAAVEFFISPRMPATAARTAPLPKRARPPPDFNERMRIARKSAPSQQRENAASHVGEKLATV